MNRLKRIPILLLAALLLAACAPGGEPASDEPTATAAPQDPGPTATTPPEPDPEPTADNPWQSANPPLPAEPQAQTFTTPDGRTLNGWYYPASANPAPLLVLMHWAGGDQYDWWQIAPWLQNRPAEYTPGQWPGTGLNGAWLDPSWFPEIRPEASFGVLVFDFSGFGSSPFGGDVPADWLMDAAAALDFAATLEGADPNRLLAMGASIGADGAVDACTLLNRQTPAEGTCIAALALSPGNYLGAPFSFSDGAVELADTQHLVACLTAAGDSESGPVCGDIDHSDVGVFFFEGNAHAMSLIAPQQQAAEPPDAGTVLDIVLAWLEEATGLPVSP